MRKALKVFGLGVLAAVLAASLEAARPAPVSSGLAFGLTLSNGGISVSGDRFTLRVPGAKGSLVLTFEGVALVGDGLEAPARLKNGTDLDLYGLRLDFVSATETERVEPGKTGRSRPLPASAVSPLAFAALGKGRESEPLRWRVTPIVFGTETGLVVVLGVVSGVASVATFEVEGVRHPSAIETDAGGNVLLTDASGKVFRAGPDGRGAAELKILPAPRNAPSGGACARHRAAGRVCREGPDGSAWVIEGREISVFDADGLRVRSFEAGGTGPPVALAFGREGLLYVATYGEDGGRPGTVRVFRLF
jgi:hypothetical protein